MDFRLSAADDDFRSSLLKFLGEELPPGWEGRGRWAEDEDWDFTKALRRKMADKGWLTMHWPEEYGGQGVSPVRSALFNEEMSYNRPERQNARRLQSAPQSGSTPRWSPLRGSPACLG